MGQWRELNAIPGSFNVYRVSNAQLQEGPFNLSPGTIIRWQIRSRDSYGWGEWADGNEQDVKQNDPVAIAKKVRSAAPPNGLQCVNSWWNGFQCWSPTM